MSIIIDLCGSDDETECFIHKASEKTIRTPKVIVIDHSDDESVASTTSNKVIYCKEIHDLKQF